MNALENADTLPAPDDDDHERECVEQVFGLTGGELSDKPWEPWEPSALWYPESFDFEYASKGAERRTFPYWYDGVPDYAGEDFDDEHASGVTYLTVVTCVLFGGPPKVLREKDPWKPLSREWRLVGMYASSGETECPGHITDTTVIVTSDQRLTSSGRCVLCEEAVGEEHGYIYLGDGWVEAVYRSEDPSDPLGEGFDVGTVVWWKNRFDDNWDRLIVAAGPAPEDYEGMFLTVPEDDEDREYLNDDDLYIDAEDYEVAPSP